MNTCNAKAVRAMSAIVAVLIAGFIMMARSPNRYEDLKALADRLDGRWR
ncbi:MAG: hypothetical protein R3F19_00960 [Verrucomicrobiales bacterium]